MKMDISVDGTDIRAVDSANNEVVIETVGFDYPARPVVHANADQSSISGLLSSATFPYTTVECWRDGRWHDSLSMGPSTDPIDLPGGPWRLEMVETIRTVVTFEGAATLYRLQSGDAQLSFEHPTRVTIGFESPEEVAAETMPVAPTPAGLASALTASDAALTESSPLRTWPRGRRRSPHFEIAETTEVPASVAAAQSDAAVELHVPDALQDVFVVAPLAHYLGATVSVDATLDAPVLRAPSVELRHPLPARPELQYAANDLLRRLFFLDWLVSAEAMTDQDQQAFDTASYLDPLGIDRTETYDQPLPVRVATYLDVPFERVSNDLPSWHYVLAMPAVADSIPALPHLLDRLVQVYLPGALSECDRAASLDTGIAQCRGHVGPNPPEDAFRAMHAAYVDRGAARSFGEGSGRVVVFDDGSDRASQLVEAYRTRLSSVEIAVVPTDGGQPTTTPPEWGNLLHVVGDFDRDWLTDYLGDVVVVDAPGSAAIAPDLVRVGATTVIGRQDGGNGFDGLFLSLVTHGIPICIAAQVARQETATNDFAVVGDGANRVTFDDTHNHLVLADTAADGRFSLEIIPFTEHTGYALNILDGLEMAVGAKKLTVDVSDLRRLLTEIETVLVVDGVAYPSTDETLEPFYPLV